MISNKQNEMSAAAEVADSSNNSNQETVWPADTAATVLILQHSPAVPPAYTTRFFSDNGIPFHVLHIDSSTPSTPVLPPLSLRWKCVVSLGGPQGSYEESTFEWIAREKSFLAHCISSDTPTLGICLGAQFMADIVGGKTFKAEGGMEVGYPTVKLTEEGMKDQAVTELFKKIGEGKGKEKEESEQSDSSLSVDTLLMHHGDTFRLPSSIPVLALSSYPSSSRSSSYPQLFRCGPSLRSWAVQFHPESGWSELAQWTAWNPDRYLAIGSSREQILKDAKEKEQEALRTSRIFFQSWWESNGEQFKLTEEKQK